jgi:RHS repeat-associated protein
VASPSPFHTDNLSTPYAATDASGAVAERYDIEPFGRMTVTQGTGHSQPLGSKVGLHGGWFDHDTGRIYFRQRVYDPLMARFLSRDPLGFWGAAVNLGNSYCFVANGPTIWRDPSGLNPTILLTSFKTFGGRTTNPSQSVASAVESNLKSAGASTESLTISVDWKQGQKQLTDKIAEIKKNNPNAKVIVLGLGQSNKDYFRLETVARNERGLHRDENKFTPSLGDKNNASDDLKHQRRAPGIAGDVAKNLGIATSTYAGQFVCDACAYEIYSQVDSGAIESGFFIHVSQTPTEDDINKFASRAGALFGPKGDLDGDGLQNGSMPYEVKIPTNFTDPNPGKPDPWWGKPEEPGKTP